MNRISDPRLSRRRLMLAGAGTAGAVAAARLVPAVREDDTTTAQAPQSAAPEHIGYRVTDHVLRYYQTAKV